MNCSGSSDFSGDGGATLRSVTVLNGDAITVVRREGFRCLGRRVGNVAVYDFDLSPDYEVRSGVDRRQRCYLMFDEGLQLTQPVTFPDSMAGWWYVDLIRCVWSGSEVTVVDMFVDVIVGPPDKPYEVLDLDELAAVCASGELSSDDVGSVLTRTQSFLNRHLNRRGSPGDGWVDFPPTALDPVRSR